MIAGSWKRVSKFIFQAFSGHLFNRRAGIIIKRLNGEQANRFFGF